MIADMPHAAKYMAEDHNTVFVNLRWLSSMMFSSNGFLPDGVKGMLPMANHSYCSGTLQ
jgi:hypothetical protein